MKKITKTLTYTYYDDGSVDVAQDCQEPVDLRSDVDALLNFSVWLAVRANPDISFNDAVRLMQRAMDMLEVATQKARDDVEAAMDDASTTRTLTEAQAVEHLVTAVCDDEEMSHGLAVAHQAMTAIMDISNDDDLPSYTIAGLLSAGLAYADTHDYDHRSLRDLYNQISPLVQLLTLRGPKASTLVLQELRRRAAENDHAELEGAEDVPPFTAPGGDA